MSFHEISIAVRAENRASYAFRAIAMDVVHLGYSFGLLDSQAGRVISGIMSAIHVMTSLKAVIASTTTVQTAQNVATATHTGLLSGAVTALGAKVAALLGLTTATNTATGATMAFNVALAFKVGLLTLGVGVIIAAAAAMSILASQTRVATEASKEYYMVSSRGVRRMGEEESELLRQGVID